MIKSLVRAGADVHIDDRYPSREGNALTAAAARGHTAIVRFLLEAGMNPNSRTEEYTAIGSAAREGHAEIVEALEARGAQVIDTFSGEHILHHAAAGGHVAIVTTVLTEIRSIPVSGKGWTPLHTASGHHRTEVLGLLIDAGAVVDARTTLGETPLILASGSRGGESTVRLLLERGADPNLSSYGPVSRNALHHAIAAHDLQVVELLLAAGARTDAPDARGETPLAHITRSKHPDAPPIADTVARANRDQ